MIDGRDPGHLRSTAVDSFEIESSSRSVTMSSLRFWLGRRPSTPQHWGDFMNFNWGHKCECTWKLFSGGGGLNLEYRPDNHNNHSKEEGKLKQQGLNEKLKLTKYFVQNESLLNVPEMVSDEISTTLKTRVH